MCPSTFFGTLDCFSDNIIVAASAFTVPFVALKSASRSLFFLAILWAAWHTQWSPRNGDLECQKIISFLDRNVSSANTYQIPRFYHFFSGKKRSVKNKALFKHLEHCVLM